MLFLIFNKKFQLKKNKIFINYSKLKFLICKSLKKVHPLWDNN